MVSRPLPDVALAGFTAFEHQVLVGAMEGRDPGPDFDAGFYVQQNQEFPTTAPSHP